MINITHIIAGVYRGGASSMLIKLLNYLDKSYFNQSVIILMEKSTLAEKIEETGIKVYPINLHRGQASLTALFKILPILKQEKTGIIQGWMYHGDTAASMGSIMLGNSIPVIWNIRHTPNDLNKEKRGTARLIQLGKYLSKQPRNIIYNSRVSAAWHESFGYKEKKSVIIPNGFDLERFIPNKNARFSIRREIGVSDNTILIGLISRYHEMKNFENFIDAASRFVESHTGTHFLLVGREVTSENEYLKNLLFDKKIDKFTHLLGERTDIPDILASLDICTMSSSWGEGFPNIIGEAMSCEIPCVVTDIGDSAYLVGDTGSVIPPNNPEALASSWKYIIELNNTKKLQMGENARKRIAKMFSLEKVIAEYETLYKSVLL